jgi:DNA-binding MarR family transcriptional regulator
MYPASYTMQDIFFQEKSKLILLSLAKKRRKSISDVASEVKGSYAHIYNLIKTLENQDIVETEKKGRTKYISLTDKGEKLAETLKDFEAILNTGVKPGVTKNPTVEKLERYQNSLLTLLKEAEKKSLPKHPRLLGRYRSLVRRLRPRSKEGRKLKADINELIGTIESQLRG